jgi:small subunit ribosomal protein S1
VSEETENESFAQLLDKTLADTTRLKPGDKVKATIVEITDDWIFLDLAGKREGYLSSKELEDKDGRLSVTKGDIIEAYFLGREHDELLFTTRIGSSLTDRGHLEQAHQSGIPVDGYVEKEIKGGFQIKLGGTVRAFCPHSQMDLPRTGDADDYLGNHLAFKIIEYEEHGRNIIVSRRLLLQEEREAKKASLQEILRENQRVRGRITSIRDFGAFLDVGGVEGLIPVSEVSWGHVNDINAHLVPGDEVEVLVKSLDWDSERFTFSIKETLPDPWETVTDRYPEGSHHTGTVVRLTNFGAFVTLEPGVDGLVHISRLGEGQRGTHPRDVVQVGQRLQVRIEGVDPSRRRLSLTPTDADIEGQSRRTGDWRQYAHQGPASMGTLGEIVKASLDRKKKPRKD